VFIGSTYQTSCINTGGGGGGVEYETTEEYETKTSLILCRAIHVHKPF
jgi:hypothetical protein